MIHCKVRRPLQNAVENQRTAVLARRRKLLSRHDLDDEHGLGIARCHYKGCPICGRRVFRTLKAQIAGGDLLTLQEITNEQQKGLYTH
jgi:hypothetical protein